MGSLGKEIHFYIEGLGLDAAKRMRIMRYNRYWVRSIKRMCGDNVDLANLILLHINAAYMVKDDSYHKKEFRDKPYIVGILYVDDSTVRSELVNRTEAIRCEMLKHEANLHEVRVLSSRRGMARRHPFERYATCHPEHDSIYDYEALEERNFVYQANEEYELHKVRQAMILTFGENAGAFLRHVASMELLLCRVDGSRTQRRSPNYYWLNIYTEDIENMEAIVGGYKNVVIAHAKTLGLNIREIKVYEAADMRK